MRHASLAEKGYKEAYRIIKAKQGFTGKITDRMVNQAWVDFDQALRDCDDRRAKVKGILV